MTNTRMMTACRLFAVAAVFALAIGCSGDNIAPDTGAEYRDEANKTATLLTAQERAERRAELSRKWQDARDRLQELRQTTDADGIENQWDETVAKIDREATDLGRQLDEFGDDSQQSWNEFEERVQRGLDAIGQEIDDAVAKVNQ